MIWAISLVYVETTEHQNSRDCFDKMHRLCTHGHNMQCIMQSAYRFVERFFTTTEAFATCYYT